MKYEYDFDDEPERVVKAVIDGSDDLWILCQESQEPVYYCIGTTLDDEPLSEIASVYGIKKRFYEGDQVTITF
jgi:hypothetical protein